MVKSTSHVHKPIIAHIPKLAQTKSYSTILSIASQLGVTSELRMLKAYQAAAHYTRVVFEGLIESIDQLFSPQVFETSSLLAALCESLTALDTLENLIHLPEIIGTDSLKIRLLFIDAHLEKKLSGNQKREVQKAFQDHDQIYLLYFKQAVFCFLTYSLRQKNLKIPNQLSVLKANIESEFVRRALPKINLDFSHLEDRKPVVDAIELPKVAITGHPGSVVQDLDSKVDHISSMTAAQLNEFETKILSLPDSHKDKQSFYFFRIAKTYSEINTLPALRKAVYWLSAAIQKADSASLYLYHKERGFIFQKLAERLTEVASTEDPTFKLGRSYRDSACRDFHESKKYPNVNHAQRDLVDQVQSTKNSDECAIATLQQVLREDPDYSEAYWILLRKQFEQQQFYHPGYLHSKFKPIASCQNGMEFHDTLKSLLLKTSKTNSAELNLTFKVRSLGRIAYLYLTEEGFSTSGIGIHFIQDLICKGISTHSITLLKDTGGGIARIQQSMTPMIPWQEGFNRIVRPLKNQWDRILSFEEALNLFHEFELTALYKSSLKPGTSPVPVNWVLEQVGLTMVEDLNQLHLFAMQGAQTFAADRATSTRQQLVYYSKAIYHACQAIHGYDRLIASTDTPKLFYKKKMHVVLKRADIYKKMKLNRLWAHDLQEAIALGQQYDARYCDPTIHYMLGNALEALGRYTEAKMQWRIVAKITTPKKSLKKIIGHAQQKLQEAKEKDSLVFSISKEEAMGFLQEFQRSGLNKACFQIIQDNFRANSKTQEHREVAIWTHFIAQLAQAPNIQVFSQLMIGMSMASESSVLLLMRLAEAEPYYAENILSQLKESVADALSDYQAERLREQDVLVEKVALDQMQLEKAEAFEKLKALYKALLQIGMNVKPRSGKRNELEALIKIPADKSDELINYLILHLGAPVVSQSEPFIRAYSRQAHRELTEILAISTHNEVNFEIEGSTLVCSGKSLFLSEIRSKLEGYKTITEIRIQSLNLYIDTALELKGVNLVLGGQYIEWMEGASLNLSGTEGAPGIAVPTAKAPDGNGDGAKGEDGCAGDNGKPGKPGGDLCIDCRLPMVGIEHLHVINLNGGKGGSGSKGQSGGHGKPGKNGRSAEEKWRDNVWNAAQHPSHVFKNRFIGVELVNVRPFDAAGPQILPKFRNRTDYKLADIGGGSFFSDGYRYFFEGEKGKPGGNGGAGGPAGLGGAGGEKGSLLLLNAAKSQETDLNAKCQPKDGENGVSGEPGEGGKGGAGGTDGCDTVIVKGGWGRSRVHKNEYGLEHKGGSDRIGDNWHAKYPGPEETRSAHKSVDGQRGTKANQNCLSKNKKTNHIDTQAVTAAIAAHICGNALESVRSAFDEVTNNLALLREASEVSSARLREKQEEVKDIETLKETTTQVLHETQVQSHVNTQHEQLGTFTVSNLEEAIDIPLGKDGERRIPDSTSCFDIHFCTPVEHPESEPLQVHALELAMHAVNCSHGQNATAILKVIDEAIAFLKKIQDASLQKRVHLDAFLKSLEGVIAKCSMKILLEMGERLFEKTNQLLGLYPKGFTSAFRRLFDSHSTNTLKACLENQTLQLDNLKKMLTHEQAAILKKYKNERRQLLMESSMRRFLSRDHLLVSMLTNRLDQQDHGEFEKKGKWFKLRLEKKMEHLCSYFSLQDPQYWCHFTNQLIDEMVYAISQMPAEILNNRQDFVKRIRAIIQLKTNQSELREKLASSAKNKQWLLDHLIELVNQGIFPSQIEFEACLQQWGALSIANTTEKTVNQILPPSSVPDLIRENYTGEYAHYVESQWIHLKAVVAEANDYISLFKTVIQNQDLSEETRLRLINVIVSLAYLETHPQAQVELRNPLFEKEQAIEFCKTLINISGSRAFELRKKINEVIKQVQSDPMIEFLQELLKYVIYRHCEIAQKALLDIRGSYLLTLNEHASPLQVDVVNSSKEEITTVPNSTFSALILKTDALYDQWVTFDFFAVLLREAAAQPEKNDETLYQSVIDNATLSGMPPIDETPASEKQRMLLVQYEQAVQMAREKDRILKQISDVTPNPGSIEQLFYEVTDLANPVDLEESIHIVLGQGMMQCVTDLQKILNQIIARILGFGEEAHALSLDQKHTHIMSGILKNELSPKQVLIALKYFTFDVENLLRLHTTYSGLMESEGHADAPIVEQCLILLRHQLAIHLKENREQGQLDEDSGLNEIKQAQNRCMNDISELLHSTQVTYQNRHLGQIQECFLLLSTQEKLTKERCEEALKEFKRLVTDASEIKQALQTFHCYMRNLVFKSVHPDQTQSQESYFETMLSVLDLRDITGIEGWITTMSSFSWRDMEPQKTLLEKKIEETVTISSDARNKLLQFLKEKWDESMSQDNCSMLSQRWDKKQKNKQERNEHQKNLEQAWIHSTSFNVSDFRKLLKRETIELGSLPEEALDSQSEQALAEMIKRLCSIESSLKKDTPLSEQDILFLSALKGSLISPDLQGRAMYCQDKWLCHETKRLQTINHRVREMQQALLSKWGRGVPSALLEVMQNDPLDLPSQTFLDHCRKIHENLEDPVVSQILQSVLSLRNSMKAAQFFMGNAGFIAFLQTLNELMKQHAFIPSLGRMTRLFAFFNHKEKLNHDLATFWAIAQSALPKNWVSRLYQDRCFRALEQILDEAYSTFSIPSAQGLPPFSLDEAIHQQIEDNRLKKNRIWQGLYTYFNVLEKNHEIELEIKEVLIKRLSELLTQRQASLLSFSFEEFQVVLQDLSDTKIHAGLTSVLTFRKPLLSALFFNHSFESFKQGVTQIWIEGWLNPAIGKIHVSEREKLIGALFEIETRKQHTVMQEIVRALAGKPISPSVLDVIKGFANQTIELDDVAIALLQQKESNWYSKIRQNSIEKRNKTRLAADLVGLMKQDVKGINQSIENLLNSPEEGLSELELNLQLIHTNLKSYKNSTGQCIETWQADDIRAWAAQNRGAHLLEDHQLLMTAIAVFCQAVALTLLKKEGVRKKDYPRDTQLIALLILLNQGGQQKKRGKLAQVATGEGKSIITAGIAIIKALSGHQIDIITTSRLLAQRDAGKKAIFELFNLTVTNNCDLPCEIGAEEKSAEEVRKSRYFDEKTGFPIDIVYGEVSGFERDRLLTEFNKHDPKKQIIHASRLNGNQTVVVDEVDGLFLDNASMVLYLSHNVDTLRFLERLFLEIWEMVHHPAFERRSAFDEEVVEFIAKRIRNKIIQKEIELPTYSVPNATFMEMKQVIDRKLINWIRSALHAKVLQLDNHYVIMGEKEKRITVVDKDTGVEQLSLKWSNGLHQFLQLKHKLALSAESLKAVFLSNFFFFKSYGPHLYGLSGTLGSDIEQKYLSTLFGVDLCKIPRFQGEKTIPYPGVVTGDLEDWMIEIKKSVTREIKEKKRAVLIVCSSIDKVKLLKRNLIDDFPHLVSYTSSFQELTILSEHVKVLPGDLIIATNLAGRGTDLKTSSLLEANGGIHVILSYLPLNIRVQEQAFGRTGRAGNEGSSEFIVSDIEMRSISELCRIRDQEERIRLESISKKEVKKIEFEQQLLKGFTHIDQQKIVGFQAIFEHTIAFFKERNEPDFYIEAQCNSLKNRWSFWLAEMEEKINLVHLIGKEAVIASFNVFYQGVLTDLNGSSHPFCLVQEPAELIKLGKAYRKIEQWSKAAECYRAAEKDPHYAQAAYYKSSALFLRAPTSDNQAKKQFEDDAKVAIKRIHQEEAFLQRAGQTISQLAQKYRGTSSSGDFGEEYVLRVQERIQIWSIFLSAIDEAMGTSLSEEDLVNSRFVSDTKKAEEVLKYLHCSQKTIELPMRSNRNLKETFQIVKHTLFRPMHVSDAFDEAQLISEGVLPPEMRGVLFKGEPISKQAFIQKCKGRHHTQINVETILRKLSSKVSLSRDDEGTKVTLPLREEVYRSIESAYDALEKALSGLDESDKWIQRTILKAILKKKIEDNTYDLMPFFYIEQLSLPQSDTVAAETLWTLLCKENVIEAGRVQVPETMGFEEFKQEAEDQLREYFVNAGLTDDTSLNEAVESVFHILDKSIGMLEKLKNIKTTVKFSEIIKKYFNDQGKNAPAGIREFIELGLDVIAELMEKKDPPAWYEVCVITALGVIQIVGGVIAKAALPVVGELIGNALISTGIDDIVFGINSAVTGEFSWGDYWSAKGGSVKRAVISAAISSGVSFAKDAYQCGDVQKAWDRMKMTGVERLNTAGELLHSQGQTFQTFNLGNHITKELGQTFVKTGLSTLAREGLNGVVAQISKSYQNSLKTLIEDAVRERWDEVQSQAIALYEKLKGQPEVSACIQDCLNGAIAHMSQPRSIESVLRTSQSLLTHASTVLGNNGWVAGLSKAGDIAALGVSVSRMSNLVKDGISSLARKILDTKNLKRAADTEAPNFDVDRFKLGLEESRKVLVTRLAQAFESILNGAVYTPLITMTMQRATSKALQELFPESEQESLANSTKHLLRMKDANNDPNAAFYDSIFRDWRGANEQVQWDNLSESEKAQLALQVPENSRQNISLLRSEFGNQLKLYKDAHGHYYVERPNVHEYAKGIRTGKAAGQPELFAMTQLFKKDIVLKMPDGRYQVYHQNGTIDATFDKTLNPIELHVMHEGNEGQLGHVVAANQSDDPTSTHSLDCLYEAVLKQTGKNDTIHDLRVKVATTLTEQRGANYYHNWSLRGDTEHFMGNPATIAGFIMGAGGEWYAHRNDPWSFTKAAHIFKGGVVGGIGATLPGPWTAGLLGAGAGIIDYQLDEREDKSLSDIPMTAASAAATNIIGGKLTETVKHVVVNRAGPALTGLMMRAKTHASISIGQIGQETLNWQRYGTKHSPAPLFSTPFAQRTLLFSSSSGAKLTSTGTQKTTTVLGNYMKDMAHIVEELGNHKSTYFGARPNDFNVLNVETSLSGYAFWKKYNEPWLQAALHRKDRFTFATSPEYRFFARSNMRGELELSGFGREWKYLRDHQAVPSRMAQGYYQHVPW